MGAFRGSLGGSKPASKDRDSQALAGSQGLLGGIMTGKSGGPKQPAAGAQTPVAGPGLQASCWSMKAVS